SNLQFAICYLLFPSLPFPSPSGFGLDASSPLAYEARLQKLNTHGPCCRRIPQILDCGPSPGSGGEDVTLLSSTIVPGLSILPFLVFLSETCVVTLSTIRTIFVARGKRALAALLGFFEVSIWLFAIGQVMQNLNSPDCFLAFATGFSLGNFLGVSLER